MGKETLAGSFLKGAKRKPGSATAAASVTCQPGKTTTEEFLAAVDMLTTTQRSFCDHVMHAVEQQGEQFFLFLSGGAGVGKSVTLRCIHYEKHPYLGPTLNPSKPGV